MSIIEVFLDAQSQNPTNLGETTAAFALPDVERGLHLFHRSFRGRVLVDDTFRDQARHDIIRQDVARPTHEPKCIRPGAATQSGSAGF